MLLPRCVASSGVLSRIGVSELGTSLQPMRSFTGSAEAAPIVINKSTQIIKLRTVHLPQ